MPTDATPRAAGRTTVLLALCGMSPAVITESVWALARGTPPLLVDRVVALTTTRGRRAIVDQLFESGVWDDLRAALECPATQLRWGRTSDDIRVFPAPDRLQDLEDIRTTADNAAAADFILEQARQFTENPDTCIVFSVAGGRKTMSVLGAVAMYLLGRECDRICHVLVNPPFDDPRLDPKFYYPISGQRHTLPDGRTVDAAAAELSLCDIPLVCLRSLFGDALGQAPGNFPGFVALANTRIDETAMPVSVTIDPERFEARINEVQVPLSGPEFVLFWMLLGRARKEEPDCVGQWAVAEALHAFATSIDSSRMPEILNWSGSQLTAKPESEPDLNYVRGLFHSLKRKLRRCDRAAARRILPRAADRGRYGLRLRPDEIRIR